MGLTVVVELLLAGRQRSHTPQSCPILDFVNTRRTTRTHLRIVSPAECRRPRQTALPPRGPLVVKAEVVAGGLVTTPDRTDPLARIPIEEQRLALAAEPPVGLSRSGDIVGQNKVVA